MSEESQAALADVIELLERADARLDVLSGPALDGAGPVAAETGAMLRARATHVQERAREMRAGLDEVRRRAGEVAGQTRDRRTELRRQAGDAAPAGWDAVAAAADQLLGTRVDDPVDVRGHLLEAGRTAVPAAAGVGLVWCDADVFVAAHPHDPVLDAVAEHARRTGDGPGPAALAGSVVHLPDVRHDSRWPALGRDAEALGLGSLLALPLTPAGRGGHRSDRESLLAAVFHAPRPHVFGPVAMAAADLFARQAAILLAGTDRVAELLAALESRDAIGQAKGILVAQHGVSPEEAFDRLVAASQTANVKLRDVAAWFVDETRQEWTGRDDQARNVRLGEMP